MEKALRLAASAPEEIASLAQTLMRELPKGGTFLDAALALLPDKDWLALVQAAVGYLRDDPENEAADSVITYASLQCVQALHPFLSELFLIDSRFNSYFGPFPWRESGDSHLDFLLRYLHAEPGAPSETEAEVEDLRARAFLALLQTRHPNALAAAAQAAPTLGYNAEQLRWSLFDVDCEQEEDGFRWLVPARVRHLRFPEGALDRPVYLTDWPFPTWEVIPPEAYSYRFGGQLETTCGLCGSPLHHLLTLDPVPEGVGVNSVSKLSMATCLSCGGYETEWLFFQHDGAGTPSAHNPAETMHPPRFPARPLLEVQVGIADTPPRWRWQDWGLSNNREHLHRLGGHPCWVQSAEFPSCPCCTRTMTFLLQLDSELKAEDGYLLWGSGGIAYLFWCDACRVSAAMWQCT